MQISDRLSQIKPSLTLAMNAKALELKDKGIMVTSLAIGQPDFPTPKHICEAAKAAIDAIDPAQAQMPLVLDRRGDVLLALGDVEGARKCWEDALERDRASGELLALLSLKIQALPEKKS